MTLPRISKIAYGGDYNPEQWPREVWEADHAAFDEARIDTVTVGVFAWALTQPAEDRYDLSLLAEIIDRAAAAGRQVCLATGTGALPPWLAHQYPEVCRTDFEGRRHVYGQRHNACPSSPVYRRLAAALAGAVAERFGNHPSVIAWHINNEYGGACYCELCAAEFRGWLQARYGSLDRLNDAWNTAFWSHRFTDWEQIVVPNALSEHWRGPDHTAFQGITLDFRRFTTDNLLRTYAEEKAAIRVHSQLPVTTNFMGMYQPLDYHRWAAELDFASWDNYPPDAHSASRMALTHDLMRGLKDGQPFWLMEQTPTVTASREVNPLKRPGVMRLWSWQAVAHGADSVLFFQLRQSRGACEKLHGAVLNHAGRTDTRQFREVAGLGAELELLGDGLLGARTPARVALLFDWDSWWALEITDAVNRHVRYQQFLIDHHRALWQAGAQLDVVPVTADLSGYDVVVAPALHLVKGDLVERLAAVARRGGTVVATVLSGMADEDGRAFLTDLPGLLGPLFCVRIDETDSAEPGALNHVELGSALKGRSQASDDPESVTSDSSPAWGAAAPADRSDLAPGRPEPTPRHPGLDTEALTEPVVAEARLVFDLVQPQGAEVLGRYTSDFYAGTPAVTRNRVGDGEAWYLGTWLDEAGLAWVFSQVLGRHGLTGPYAGTGVEHAVREQDGRRYEFLLNHGDRAVEVTAHAAGSELLGGRPVALGERLRIDANDVLVVQTR